MAPNDEPNAAGGQLQFPGLETPQGMQPQGRRGRSKARTAVSSQVDVSLPKVDALSKSIDKLLLSMTKLRDMMLSFSAKKAGTKMASELDAACRACMGGMGAATTHVDFGGGQPNVWQSGGRDLADRYKIPQAQAVNGAAGAGPTPVTPSPRTNTNNSSPTSGDLAGASAIGAGVGDVANKLGGGQGLGGILSGVISGIPEMYGALAGGSLQYTYNRINGPTGNMNAMLQLANQLAPNVTMMNAAGGRQGGGPLSLQDTIAGLAQKMPIMGTQQDMINTILAGQSVGALMTGTPGRNGFFEASRQAQVLNPGQAPGTIAGGIAGFIGNVGAQQRGAMMGEGAFSMIGQGGSYKTLSEWASAITKFLEQHRPGGAQGNKFTKAELITQNFPGSNINAWFQFMGVPQQMVDYWWQYALTEADSAAADPVTTKTLQKDVTKARGINLGYEQLRTSTASTQRDFAFGNQMYGMYAANAAANRRFNVTMTGTDQALAQQLQGTNIGRMLALLPTPIMEMLMPILTQFFTSPAGGVASAGGAIGGLFDIGGTGGGGGGILGGAKQGLISGALNMVPGVGAINDLAGIFGDPMPYGETGATNLAHLSPDLARKVQVMMAANPQLQVSSGYRDTATQNRLRAKGATAVGSNKSAHTRGWAVDIGPASQMGWLMQNAGRFGLATGANYGEPWHIQRAGTPMVGDPSGNAMPYGGFGDIVSTIAGAVTDPVGTVTGVIGGALNDMAKGVIQGLSSIMESIMKDLMGPIQDLLRSFVGSGSYTSMIDTATNLFSKIITAPISGIANIFGKATGGRDELAALINQPVDTTVTVVGSGFGSFGSTGDLNKPFFGDPMPFGGPMSLMQGGAMSAGGGTAPVLIFHAPITISGGAGSGIDATKLANQLADRLQSEVAKREWLVS